jgi:hypothetical protein
VNGNAGVQCRCANGHVEEADILIGADGAYSAVRQNLYRALREKNQLPKSDMEPLKFTLNAVMGISEPLDVEQYPCVGGEFSDVNIIVGKDSPHTLWLTPTVGNRLAWSVGGELLTPEGCDNVNFKQSEFGPEAIDAACALIQDLALPWGGTLGDIIARTRRDFITKVMVEEKHYKTWHHGRTVLIGEGEYSCLICAHTRAYEQETDSIVICKHLALAPVIPGDTNHTLTRNALFLFFFLPPFRLVFMLPACHKVNKKWCCCFFANLFCTSSERAVLTLPLPPCLLLSDLVRRLVCTLFRTRGRTGNP